MPLLRILFYPVLVVPGMESLPTLVSSPLMSGLVNLSCSVLSVAAPGVYRKPAATHPCLCASGLGTLSRLSQIHFISIGYMSTLAILS